MSNQISPNGSSIDKALAILLAFTPECGELGTTEISSSTMLAKSTTSRLIKILVSADFLRQSPATKKYMLGSSAYRLGTAAIRTMDTNLLALARPFLQELALKTGESTALETLSGVDVILAMQVEGPGHLRFNFQQGELVPINVAAGAKAILAHHDEVFLESCLRKKFQHFNENTVTAKDKYRALLKRVKKDGFAYDWGERYNDIHAIAAPIPNPLGPVTSAVIIAGPASRLTEPFLASVKPYLQDTANIILEHLYTSGE